MKVENLELIAQGFLHTPGHVYIKDTMLTYLMVNENMASSAGFSSPGGLLGKTDFDLLDEASAQKIAQLDRAVLQQQKVISTEEWVEVGAQLRCFHSEKRPLIIEGVLKGIIGISIDITDVKLLEKKLEKMSAMKSAVMHVTDRLIRTPLGVIYAFAEVLSKKDNLSSDLKQGLGAIYQSALKIIPTISQLEFYNSFEEDKLGYPEERFNLHTLLRDTVDLYQEYADEKGIDLIFQYAADLPYYYCGYTNYIWKIFNTLLRNALCYTKEGYVRLRVKAELEQESSSVLRLQFDVEDTGPGIPERIREKIFSMFDEAINMVRTNTGLDLSIVAKIVDKLSGTISLNTELCKGSTFSVSLPLKRTGVFELDASKYSALDNRALALVDEFDFQSAEHFLILLVEDDMLTRKALTALLSHSFNCRVHSAANLSEARILLEQGINFSLVLLDINLPDGVGLDLLGCLKEKGIGVPVVAQTACISESESDMMLDAGVDEVLLKPIKLNTLKELVVQYVYSQC